MKKYIILAWYDQEDGGGGGLNDVDSDFDTMEEVDAQLEILMNLRYGKFWYQVADRDTWQVIKEGNFYELQNNN